MNCQGSDIQHKVLQAMGDTMYSISKPVTLLCSGMPSGGYDAHCLHMCKHAVDYIHACVVLFGKGVLWSEPYDVAKPILSAMHACVKISV